MDIQASVTRTVTFSVRCTEDEVEDILDSLNSGTKAISETHPGSSRVLRSLYVGVRDAYDAVTVSDD